MKEDELDKLMEGIRQKKPATEDIKSEKVKGE